MNPMHPEIQLVQKRFMELFAQQRESLRAKPDSFLEELQHRSGELRQHEEFSIRAAAEINHAATLTLLEKRR